MKLLLQQNLPSSIEPIVQSMLAAKSAEQAAWIAASVGFALVAVAILGIFLLVIIIRSMDKLLIKNGEITDIAKRVSTLEGEITIIEKQKNPESKGDQR